MNSKWLKGQATAAKRTATVLRELAKTYGLDPADSGIMLAAARAVSMLASTRNDEAKQAKRQEDERDAFYARTQKSVREQILSTWPTTTIRDKVTLVAQSKRTEWLARMINDYPDNPLQQLNTYFEEGLGDICNHITYLAWTKKTSVTAEVCDSAREWEKYKFDRKVIELADKISALTAPSSTAVQVATC